MCSLRRVSFKSLFSDEALPGVLQVLQGIASCAAKKVCDAKAFRLVSEHDEGLVHGEHAIASPDVFREWTDRQSLIHVQPHCLYLNLVQFVEQSIAPST